MGPIHAACLRSFVKTGHEVVLHSYGPVEDRPEGVRLADANRLLPFDQVRRHRSTGSFAVAADLMRYELQAQGLGLYVDCDVYCYRPMARSDGYVLGYEAEGKVNNAILQLPPGPLLDALRSIGSRGWVPPWSRLRRRVLGRLGLPAASVYDLAWASSGPTALTWYMTQLELMHLAEPFDLFYPVPHERAWIWKEPGLRLDDVATSRTHYIHLYYSSLRQGEEVPPDTILAQILAA